MGSGSKAPAKNTGANIAPAGAGSPTKTVRLVKLTNGQYGVVVEG